MKLFNINIFVLLLSLVLVFASCDSLLDENNTDKKFNDKIVWADPILAEGVLLKAYRLMPAEKDRFIDTYGTDDAVINVLTDSMIIMATGGATSRYNPLKVYDDCYSAFLNINNFLENMDKVQNWAWKGTALRVDSTNALYRKKLKGEAHALRAWWGARLLQYHGGMGANNILLGYPIVLNTITDAKLAMLPRNTYADCVKQIFADCDIAIESLPLRWTDEGLTPNQKFVIGSINMNRMNGISVMALKSRVALLASSPAFKDQSGVTALQAAQMAAGVMTNHIGIALKNVDLEFYKTTYVTKENLSKGSEALWYTSISPVSASPFELNFFPPSLNGNGKLNPSQNLVDEFPDKNGYPISSSTIFSAATPYTDRDPRLKMYIVYNGSVFNSVPAVTINTTSGDDAIGAKTTSSRTGYYLRKLLDETVVLKKGAVVGKPKTYIRMRYTEVLLNFAEAANEAVGPDGDISGFSARGVINALRTRAGITSTAYVANLNQAEMTELIKKERRIELCFEGFRFWDLRRWKDTAKMNEPVMGINPITLEKIQVEKRVFEPYMIYPPIPYNETLIYDIIQNMGW